MNTPFSLTFDAAGLAEDPQAPNDAEHIVSEDFGDLPLLRIGLVKCQEGTRCCDNLLFFGARKLSENRLGDGCR